MLFNSINFIIFFPIVTILYFLLPQKKKWILLLVASCIFYMLFVPVYILVFGISILVDYYAALAIRRSNKSRKKWLILSIGTNIALLFIFKYFNFFNSNLHQLAIFLDWNYSIQSLQLILPLGISFHTFQSLSYILEVYHGRQKPEKHLGIYALYAMFYPKLVAGPIERPQNLLPQFYEKHYFEYQRTIDGLKLMLWGMFKKVVVADRLSVFVNQIYNNPYDYVGITLIIATVFFAVQIYCDFSGYSDIARGAAKVMGFRLVDNFNLPYFANSISDFWRRWHISLSSWLRDYLFTPLVKRQWGIWGLLYASLVTFLISGLWHGANWTYIIWGLLHGLILGIEVLTSRFRRKIAQFINYKINYLIGLIYAFSFWCFSLIFFRANSIKDAQYIAGNIFKNLDTFVFNLLSFNFNIVQNEIVQKGIGWTKPREAVIALTAIVVLIIVEKFQRDESIQSLWRRIPAVIRAPFYYILILSILVYGMFNQEKFIYFQF